MQPLGITMEQIFSDYHVKEAIEHLKTKKNSSGPDGIPLHDIEDYWIYNKTSILTSLFEGNYYPGVTEERYLLKPNGTKRTISSICSLDRLLLRVLAQVIQPYMEPDFSSHSYAYQNGKGITKAIEDAADFIQQGNIYVAEIDIQNFFDEIPHERLFHLLENLFIDKRICNLIMRYVSYSYRTLPHNMQKPRNCFCNMICPLIPRKAAFILFLIGNIWDTAFPKKEPQSLWKNIIGKSRLYIVIGTEIPFKRLEKIFILSMMEF